MLISYSLRVSLLDRCRPLNAKEQAESSDVVVHVDSPSATVTLWKPTDGSAEQKQIYDETAVSIVESVMEGYNGTIFAYGQTGTGKTHTMVGSETCYVGKGIIPRSFEHIFSKVGCSSGKRYLVQASFLEIYNEEIRDLLAKNPKGRLELKDHPGSGVYVKGLSSFVVKGVEELQEAMLAGQRNRKVGATLMNVVSSRSHSIFTVTIESCEIVDGQENQIRIGKLNLVDLAGSERQAKAGTTGSTFKEAAKINLSLSALGNVISALVESRTSFVPYRDSKLTRLLQDSLGGNTRTAMIANIGPSGSNYEETLSTLRYAHRAKNIRNKPRINSDPKDAMIRAFQEEIAKLKAELAYAATLPRQVEKVIEVEKQVVVEVEKEVVVPVEKEVLVERVVEKVVPGPPADEDVRRLELALQEEKRLMYEDFEREKKRQEELIARLKAMEGKILEGSQVMQHAVQQEQELRQTQRELAEQRQKELQMKRDLERQQLERLTLEEKFNSREEQISCLTEKLEKLWRSFKTAMAEIEDLQHEFQAEREDLLDTIREMTREVKRQASIIDHFVPKDSLPTIEEHLHWDENLEDWKLAKAELTGNVLIRRTPAFAASLDIPQEALLSSVDEDFDAVTSERIQAALCTVLGADGSGGQGVAARRQNIYLEYPSDQTALHNHASADLDSGGAATSVCVSSPVAAQRQTLEDASRLLCTVENPI
ncbi:kinesin-ii motor protein, related [Neospora caninum Liverpool]|uniref:Kinesin-like protein n=1 Tax=Neospora caninum (strain Liverpool) TaxID=572307 RepID=F0V7T3_NEOCL|nr:kinesin-ii motor protein, related [Neospora caninum Liverpool]CBZ49774.1 kinesin-ii motor protein, related [Neospora caninum Liverpool]|eukprot:XP_003879809.1 kinesin-ii motor protein, related [Neospora caninum Liverpool]